MSFYEFFIDFLKGIGFFDVILPFILVYTLIYGLLMRVKLFGEEKEKRVRSLNSLVSFAFAGIIIGSINTIRAIQELIPIITIFLLVVLGIVLVGSFTLAQEYGKLFQTKRWQVVRLLLTIIFGLILLITFNLIPIASGTASFTLSGEIIDIIASLVILGIFIGITYFVSKG